MEALDKKASFFSIRANSKNLFLDMIGLWSYPIFVRSGRGITQWMYLVSKTLSRNKSGIFIFRPHAALITFPDSDKVVKYENFRHGKNPFRFPWDKSIGKFPHGSIKDLPVEEFEKKERELVRLAAEETIIFDEKGELSEAFKLLYTEMTNPVFTEFIRYLAPEFHSLVWNNCEYFK